jgi:hypothetical protein
LCDFAENRKVGLRSYGGRKEIVKLMLMFEGGALKWREGGREICPRNIDFLRMRIIISV